MIPAMIHIAPSTANSAVAAAVTASATVIRILSPRFARMSAPLVKRWFITLNNFSLREDERDTGGSEEAGLIPPDPVHDVRQRAARLEACDLLGDVG
ncbi:hypothetical protein S23_11580 [Bradyrhizobium cosmicum]|uniref:Uncharacterized protein n=1 Tax=Bradyrhizobium cosmicum TaxID=1404864 RepID=A0AAI8M9M1_9BRAD|nr:hypothetical protein S23_11580 [Bradyrhizobium cosmicum]